MASIDGGDAAQRSELVFAIRLPPEELAGRDIEGTRDRILHSVQEADPHAGCSCDAEGGGEWLTIAVMAPACLWAASLAAVQHEFPGHEVLSRQ